jgi:hypothetical protein
MAFLILITLILIDLRWVAAVLQVGIRSINVASVRVLGDVAQMLTCATFALWLLKQKVKRDQCVKRAL